MTNSLLALMLLAELYYMNVLVAASFSDDDVDGWDDIVKYHKLAVLPIRELELLEPIPV